MSETTISPPRLISWKELRQRVPLSRVHVGRLERAGKFPKRVQITEARVGWLSNEIDEYVRARAALRTAVAEKES